MSGKNLNENQRYLTNFAAERMELLLRVATQYQLSAENSAIIPSEILVTGNKNKGGEINLSSLKLVKSIDAVYLEVLEHIFKLNLYESNSLLNLVSSEREYLRYLDACMTDRDPDIKVSTVYDLRSRQHTGIPYTTLASYSKKDFPGLTSLSSPELLLSFDQDEKHSLVPTDERKKKQFLSSYFSLLDMLQRLIGINASEQAEEVFTQFDSNQAQYREKVIDGLIDGCLVLLQNLAEQAPSSGKKPFFQELTVENQLVDVGLLQFYWFCARKINQDIELQSTILLVEVKKLFLWFSNYYPEIIQVFLNEIGKDGLTLTTPSELAVKIIEDPMNLTAKQQQELISYFISENRASGLGIGGQPLKPMVETDRLIVGTSALGPDLTFISEVGTESRVLPDIDLYSSIPLYIFWQLLCVSI